MKKERKFCEQFICPLGLGSLEDEKAFIYLLFLFFLLPSLKHLIVVSYIVHTLHFRFIHQVTCPFHSTLHLKIYCLHGLGWDFCFLL